MKRFRYCAWVGHAKTSCRDDAETRVRLATGALIHRALLLFGILAIQFQPVGGRIVLGQESEEFRTWTDRTGQHRYEAKLLGTEGNVVRLQTADGKLLSVPKDKLSEADNTYLATRNFPLMSGAEGFGRKGDGKSMAFFTGRELQFHDIDSWSVPPDPAELFELGGIDATVGEKSAIYATLLQADYSPNALLFTAKRGGNLYAQRLDLRGQQPVGRPISLPSDLLPVSVSPSGRRLLCCSHRDTAEVSVYDLSEDKLTIAAQWYAIAKDPNFTGYVSGTFPLSEAYFVDDRYVVTSHQGIVALWDLESMELRWWVRVGQPRIHFDPFPRLAISPGRNQLIVPVWDQLICVQLPSGQVLARREIPRIDLGYDWSISPDGQWLLAIGFQDRTSHVVQAFRLHDLQWIGSMGLELLGAQRILTTRRVPAPRWITHERVLLSSDDVCDLIDLAEWAPVQRIVSGFSFVGDESQVASDGNGRIAYVQADRGFDGGGAVLRTVDLSAASEIQQMASAGQPAELVLKPGAAVALNVKVTYNERGNSRDVSDEARRILVRQLEMIGFQVDQTAAVRLELDLEIFHNVVTSQAPAPQTSSFAKSAADPKMPQAAADSQGFGGGIPESRETPQDASTSDDAPLRRTGGRTIISSIGTKGSLMIRRDNNLVLGIGVLSPIAASHPEFQGVATVIESIIIPQYIAPYRGTVLSFALEGVVPSKNPASIYRTGRQ